MQIKMKIINKEITNIFICNFEILPQSPEITLSRPDSL